MINEIVMTDPIPMPQEGEVTRFQRRKPEDGNLANLETPAEIYDYIRMLDAEGYPIAFLESDRFRLEFSKADLVDNNLIAQVSIKRK